MTLGFIALGVVPTRFRALQCLGVIAHKVPRHRQEQLVHKVIIALAVLQTRRFVLLVRLAFCQGPTALLGTRSVREQVARLGIIVPVVPQTRRRAQPLLVTTVQLVPQIHPGLLARLDSSALGGLQTKLRAMPWSGSIVRQVQKRVPVRLATSVTTALVALQINRRAPPLLGATVAVAVPFLPARNVPKDICAKEVPQTSKVVEEEYSLATIVLVELPIQLHAQRVSTVQVARRISCHALQHLANTALLGQSLLLVLCARWDIFAVGARVTRQSVRHLWGNTVRQEPRLQQGSVARLAIIAQVVLQILSPVLPLQDPIAMRAAQ